MVVNVGVAVTRKGVGVKANGVNEVSQIRVIQTTPPAQHPVAKSLKQGLVVWYPLDNVQGRNVIDSSGNNHNVTATGDLTAVPGMLGGGIEIDEETLILSAKWLASNGTSPSLSVPGFARTL